MKNTNMLTIKTYSELLKLPSFSERFDYLRTGSIVGDPTFGMERYLNQTFYRSKEWMAVRRDVIIRDNGCDLGLEGYAISGSIIVHHMNPITIEDIETRNPKILNPEFLICVSDMTHKAIHYGDGNFLPRTFVERKPNDTCPWKQ